MEEIASHAGVNKAMLYYYFNTKENLYREVLSQILQQSHDDIVDRVRKTINGTGDPISSIREFISAHAQVCTGNPQRTKIFVEAFVTQPQDIEEIFRTRLCENCNHVDLQNIFQKGIDQKLLRAVDPNQVIISIIGMIIIYMAAKPMAQALLALAKTDETDFLQNREESIIDLVMNGIVNHTA
jgi:TetR/AcrR family transcriptional regulator